MSTNTVTENTHWLYGKKMEGFLPCPFTGKLPWVKISEDLASGCWGTKPPTKGVTVCVLSQPWGFEVRGYWTYEVQWGYTVEQCKEKALEKAMKAWNERSAPAA